MTSATSDNWTTVRVMRSSAERVKNPGGGKSYSVNTLSLIGVALSLLGMRGIGGGGPVTHRFFNFRSLSRTGFEGLETVLEVVAVGVLYIWNRLAGRNDQLRFRENLYMPDGLLVERANISVVEIFTRLGKAAEGL